MLKIGRFITRLLSAGAYPPRPWRFRIAAMLLLLLLVWPVSQYLGLVLRNPQRTGMLLIGTNYAAPWDINPWCEENLALLEGLDKHNLSLRRLSDPGMLAFGQWAELSDDIEHLVEGTATQQPLLVYINLHGMVGIDGQPSFIVSDSKPLDCSTWLPLDALVQRIQQSLPQPRHVVIAIEGGRQHALPLPVNQQHSFADAVRQWYAALQSAGQAQNLSLILSSSSRLSSVAHAGSQCDLFTSCLAEALAGLCDQPKHGGNANHQIEWSELHQYIHEHVEQRSRQLRAVPQLTQQFDTPGVDGFLAWSTAVDVHSQLASNQLEPEPAQIESLTEAWKRIYALQSARPWHEEPAAWGMLKRSMVAWEQALFNGPAVRSQASLFRKSAEQLIVKLESMVSEREQMLDLETMLARRAAKLWKQLAAAPAYMTAQQILEADNALAQFTHWPTAPLLIHMAEHPELAIWGQPDRLRRWCELASQVELLRSMQSETPRVAAIVAIEQQIDVQRRRLEDLICTDGIDEQWMEALKSLEPQVHRWRSMTEQLNQTVQFNEQMLARLPALCAVVDMLDAIDGADNSDASGGLNSRLSAIQKAIVFNEKQLTAGYNDQPSSSELEQDQVRPDIAEVQTLLGTIAQRWQRLLFDQASASPTHILPLEALLNSGLLPIEIGSIDKAVQLRLTTHKRLIQSMANSDNDEHSEPHVDFVVRGSVRLDQWLDWSADDRRPDQMASSPAARLWPAMHRARARVCFGLDESLNQPVRDWQAAHVSSRRAEATQRVLDDFWKTPLIDGQAYYDALARAYLTDVQARDRAAIEAVWQARQQAADSGLQLDCACRPVWNDASPRLATCRVVQREAGVPPGVAALQVVRAGSTEALAPMLRISVGEAGQSSTHQLPTPQPVTLQLSTQLPSAQANALVHQPAVARVFFRGHCFQSAFDIHPKIGHASAGSLAGGGPASITVQTSSRQRRVRMLVLDCSASMHESHAIEGALDATNLSRASTRWDAARMATESILDHWRNRADYVGVVLYGHRVAMGTPEQGKLLQPRYLSRYPFARELEAFEDVETILPPGRLGDSEVSEVTQRLQHVVPWGQTPLYLSVQQATNELSRLVQAPHAGGTPITDSDIIVVSDGRNYQFNPTPDKNVTLEQVIQQANLARVRVHVIGFGVAAGELQQATREFTQLAEQTGGSVCMEVQTALELVERIDALTQPETFRVRLPDGQWIDSRCNVAVTIPSLPESNVPIVVDYQQTSTLIPANPNAVVRLVPNAAKRLVQAQPAFQSSAHASISTPEGQISPFEIMLNSSPTNMGGARWQLALERRDEQVSQRPKYLWLELQPQPTTPTTDSTTYVVCDPLWQAGTTEPVLSFDTEDWPQGTASGALKFWCSDQMPEPIVKFNCTPAELANDWKSADAHDADAGGQVRYQLQSETDGVTLVLFHGQPSEVLELMPLIEPLPGQTRIDRRYHPSQCISVHRFIHRDLNALPNLTVSIHSVSAFKARALRSSTAIETNFPKNIASVPVPFSR